MDPVEQVVAERGWKPCESEFAPILYRERRYDVPAMAREKPVLEALSGAKYNNQRASVATSVVPTKCTRIVTHLQNSVNIVSAKLGRLADRKPTA